MANIAKVVIVEKAWLSTKDLMKYLGVSKEFIDRLRHDGLINYYKPFGERMVFYRKSEIDAKIKKGKVL